MKRFLLCLCTLAAVPQLASAQEPEMPQPTEAHKLLEKDTGTWTGEMKMFMAGPDQPPMVMAIKETNTMMEGGFWSLSEFEAGPFKGKGQFGYDPMKKKFVGTWIDSSSPFLSVMEGDYDDEGSTLTMFFDGMDMASGKIVKRKSVTKHVNKNKREFTMYKQAGEKWEVEFIMSYQRAE